MAFVADAARHRRSTRCPRSSARSRRSPIRQAVRYLARLIRQERPHVLHTHTAKAGAVGRAAARLAGSARPPVVVHTFHGHTLEGYFGPRNRRAYRIVERTLARETDALIAV